MPLRIFDFKCQSCGFVEESIVDTDTVTKKCPECTGTMLRQPPIFSINMGASGAYGYYDDNLQTYIHTNKQRRDEMKRQGVSEKVGKGWY